MESLSRRLKPAAEHDVYEDKGDDGNGHTGASNGQSVGYHSTQKLDV
jgi:hypothetical protein